MTIHDLYVRTVNYVNENITELVVFVALPLTAGILITNSIMENARRELWEFYVDKAIDKILGNMKKD